MCNHTKLLNGLDPWQFTHWTVYLEGRHVGIDRKEEMDRIVNTAALYDEYIKLKKDVQLECWDAKTGQFVNLDEFVFPHAVKNESTNKYLDPINGKHTTCENGNA